MRETLSSEISPRKIATAQWWQDRVSVFEGLDKSLCLDENIEKLGGVEVRKYWSTHDADDLSRARFKSCGIEIGLELNPPPDVEPFEHFCYEFRKDQEENNDDYQRRSRKEGVYTELVKNGEEIKKENRAELAEWIKARKEAEDVIDVLTVDLSQVVFDKAAEIAFKRGVSSQFLLDLKQIKHVEKSTRTICTVPNAGQAAAAFCTRLAAEAQKLERLEVGEETPASQRAPTSKKKRQFKGFEGLPKKPETETERLIDAARLTRRQHECALLRWVYQQDVAEIARRLELKSRKSVQAHLGAAKARMDSNRAKFKRDHGVRTSPATTNL